MSYPQARGLNILLGISITVAIGFAITYISMIMSSEPKQVGIGLSGLMHVIAFALTLSISCYNNVSSKILVTGIVPAWISVAVVACLSPDITTYYFGLTTVAHMLMVFGIIAIAMMC